MTEAEILEERRVIIETRLGDLCGKRQPTREQRNIAQREADNWEDGWRLKVWRDAENGKILQDSNDRTE